MRWISVAVALLACRSHAARAPRAELEISTALPGASAQDIESSVTTPLERQLGQIDHLADMRSHSTLGLSTIDLAFEPGTDADASMMAVQQAISAASNLLPRSLPGPPTFARVGKVVARYAFRSDVLPLSELRDTIEPVIEKVAQVAGVGLVDLCGAGARELRIDVDPAMLAGAGLTPLDVVNAIKGSQPVNDFHSVVVAAKNGAPIRLADVAVVSDGSSAPTCLATSERGRIVEMIVWAPAGADDADVRGRVDAVVAQMRRALPTSIDSASIGVMHVLMIGLHAAAMDQIRAATTAATRVLIEQRGNVVRLGIEADDDTVANIRGLVERVANVTVVEPDATLELTGADRDALIAFARTIESRLGPAIPLGLDQTMTLRIEVDRDAAGRLAITASDIDGTLATLGGVQATTMFTQLTQYPVIVRVASEQATLDQVYVHSVRGELIPLSAIAKQVGVADGERWHVGQFPMVGFRVRAATVPDLAELHAPPSIQVRLVPD